MGRMCHVIDPLKFPPRNVRDEYGQIRAFYFPSSHKLRFIEGDTVEVDTNGNFKRHTGHHGLLDIDALIVRSTQVNAK